MPKKSKSKNNVVATRAKTASTPVAVGTKVAGATVPKIANKPDGSCTISHQEYCFDVYSAVTTATNVYQVNPQRASMFTWLTALATRFEMYRFKKLKFHYRPSTSTNTSGFVVLAFDFDAYDQEEGSFTGSLSSPGKAELLAWRYSQKSAPWQAMTLDVSNDSRISTYRYCDFGSRGDRRLDVLGNFVTLSDGGSAVQCVGEVFVEYTVEFRSPSYKIPPALYSYYEKSSAMSGADNWFSTTLANNFIGNMSIKVLDKNSILLNEVGDFLLEALIGTVGGVSTVPTITFSPGSANSRFQTHSPFAVNNSTLAIRSVPFSVEVPPLQIDFGDITGTDAFPRLRFSTYKYPTGNLIP